MIYRRNLPGLERSLRTCGGVAIAAVSLGMFGLTPSGLVGAATGIFVVLTGVFGFCPACALLGRRPVE